MFPGKHEDVLTPERIERGRIIIRLEETWARYSSLLDFWGRNPVAATMLFKVMTEVGDWNRAHPNLAIPKMVNGKVPPAPMLVAPQAPDPEAS